VFGYALPAVVEAGKALDTHGGDDMDDLTGRVLSLCVTHLCILEMCGDLENEIDEDHWTGDKLEMLERKHLNRLTDAYGDAAIAVGHSAKEVFGSLQ
jgi:hypothetical protein